MKSLVHIGHFFRHLYSRYPRVCGAISLCFFVVLGFLARCYNYAFVFISGNIYFTDGDCYSRMTRVRMVLAHPFTVIHHQNFENYPQGITSHATAPFDYLIALLAVLLKPLTVIKSFKFDLLDLAGAIVSPLLGVAMIVFLWDWSRRLKLPHGGIMLLLFAINPVLIHGTVLGRPDHQSLQMLCLVVALGAEWCFSQKPSRGWGIASGAAWGLGLWVSLYEPLILLALVALLYLIFDRRKLWAPERKAGYAVFAAIIALMLLIDGLPFSPPDKILLEYFPRWETTIEEMKPVGFFAPLEWAGYGLIAAPVLLLLRYREDKRVVPILIMLLAVYGLTIWQRRWGYFFGIVFTMSLPFIFAGLRKSWTVGCALLLGFWLMIPMGWGLAPWQMRWYYFLGIVVTVGLPLQFAAFRKSWIVVWVFLLSLWPVFVECHAMLYPTEKTAAQLQEQKNDTQALRVVAEYLKTGESLPVLAPWWFCPQIAYWSGQPAVAGTSHESMPGIVDTSRFYITTDYDVAQKILRERGVKCVIAYDSERVLDTSSALLDKPADQDKSLAAVLYRSPHSAPPFLKFVTYNLEFKIFKVMPEEPER